MSDKCRKCNLLVARDGIKCSKCGDVYHISCAENTSRKNWKCSRCVAADQAGSNKNGDSQVLAAIAALRADIKQSLDSVNSKMDAMQADIKGMSVDVTSLKAAVSTLEGTCSNTSEEVQQLKEENRRLSNQLEYITQRVENLEQHTRKNNLLLTGIPVTANENINEILASIARLLQVEFYRSDISAAHRLPARAGDARPPSIVVCFVSRAVKADWLSARRKRRSLSAQELHRNFPDVQVYLNDHLTTESRVIFNAARAMVKKNALGAVWTSEGRVIATRTGGGRPLRVRDLDHLQDLQETRRPARNSKDATRDTEGSAHDQENKDSEEISKPEDKQES